MARQSKGASNKGQQVNKSELANFFGVSLPTVDGWMRNGCPVIQRGTTGRPAIYNTADVVNWLRDRAREEASGASLADEGELKRRKLAAEAEKAELEVAKAKGEVATIRDFERVQAAMMAAIRANMRNVPGRAVLQLLGCTDEAEFKAKLMEEIDLALVTAADVDLQLEDDDSGGADE